MLHFADKLTTRIATLANPTCVGLDPRLNQIPDFILDQAMEEFGETTEGIAEAIIEFNMGIIDAIHDIVPAVKPQIAFYECYGSEGFRAYEETIAYAQKKGLLVIGDAKRNDIGSTATAYAKGHLGKVDGFDGPISTINADSLTVTPYLGTDGIKPFTDVCQEEGKGIFVLVRTSNPSSDEIQGQALGDHLMDEHVASLVEGWGFVNLSDNQDSHLLGPLLGQLTPKKLACFET